MYATSHFTGVRLTAYDTVNGSDNFAVMKEGKQTLKKKPHGEFWVAGKAIPALMMELQKWLDLDAANPYGSYKQKK